MQLTKEQETAVRTWAEEGVDLSEIQRRLNDDYDLNITYMETRFLVADLEVSLKDKEKADLKSLDASAPDGMAADPMGPDLADDDDAFGSEPGMGGGVSVSLDQIAKPNTLISGSVTFSDGQTAEWYIDVNQQLGMVPPSPGYKPTTEDLMAFQEELRRVVERGY